MPMMGLTTVRVHPPHAPQEWFELREHMSPFHVEQSRQSTSKEALEIRGLIVQAFGTFERYLEVVEAARSLSQSNAAHVVDVTPDGDTEGAVVAPQGPSPAPVADLRDAFDLDVASVSAIKSWGYQKPGGRGPVPVTLDNVRLLDGETRDWLHDRVWATMQAVVAGESPGN